MKLRPGATGWVAVGSVIVAAELLDSRTMSEGFRDLSRTPIGRYALTFGWGMLTAHLFGLIPPKFDPISQMWIYVRRDNAGGIATSVQLVVDTPA